MVVREVPGSANHIPVLVHNCSLAISNTALSSTTIFSDFGLFSSLESHSLTCLGHFSVTRSLLVLVPSSFYDIFGGAPFVHVVKTGLSCNFPSIII